VLSKIANELIYLGHSVDFMSSEKSNEPYFPTSASIKWINERGEIVKSNSTSSVKDSAMSIQQKLTRALKKLPKDSYDVIIANHSLTTLPIKRAGLSHKTIYYIQAYEPDLYKLLGGIKNKILVYFSERSYKMKLYSVVNSENYFNYKKLKSSRVLYPGVDPVHFYPKAKKIASENNNKIIIGTVGRVESYKGTRYIIEAFKILKRKYSSIELHLAFSDPKDFRDCDGIFCFNPNGDEHLGNFYRSLDYYICAGYVQLGAFHYPVVEAMSCGVSVITTSYYPAKENNAWITTPQKAEEIVKQFELAENNQHLRETKIKQALEDVKQFAWPEVGERFNNYLKEFINSKK
jgi:glycosyltransferase involved in cell wall biosynthesis